MPHRTQQAKYRRKMSEKKRCPCGGAWTVDRTVPQDFEFREALHLHCMGCGKEVKHGGRRYAYPGGGTIRELTNADFAPKKTLHLRLRDTHPRVTTEVAVRTVWAAQQRWWLDTTTGFRVEEKELIHFYWRGFEQVALHYGPKGKDRVWTFPLSF